MAEPHAQTCTGVELLHILGVQIITFSGLHQHAWHLAASLNRPTAYDTHYLALAEHLHCPFWTADERLSNATNLHFSLL